ncbi:putative flavo protein monooxygenase acting on aromatic compound [Cylindrobasidium torrendii FP15055 ss-10]|uniref:Putative flavo protein monooxygenase acting on aromatic compound n=1 Tax=Cylindrobasidium torrendii FP15055 ss-10 TaxID=1314674 RepID=A0A0D7BIP3_9AGAR|nr:putative flavo protein monooxygenase acting on aromatic compound [Cylindrobasidium torrendii FP15055 ss-10]
MKVIIIGGGIGGLSASIAMQQDGHETVVYERVSELRAAGAAISVWSNGVKVLARYGLLERTKRVSGKMERMAYRQWDTAETWCDFDLNGLYDEVKMRAYPIARSELQSMLLDANKPAPVHLSKMAISYTTSDEGVTVNFQDGTSDTGDFVIISDGTHSKLRNQLTGKDIKRDYVGYVNFNGTIEKAHLPDLPADTWTQFVGQGKRVGIMPMSDTHFYFWLDVTTPLNTAPTSPSEWKAYLGEYFTGWAPAVQTLISKMDVGKIARVEIHDTAELPTLIDLASGRAVLIGDAAHATCPDIGQGGCQALEDGFVLQQLFRAHGLSKDAKPSIEQLRAVLANYEKQRKERTALLVKRARQRSDITHKLASEEVTNSWYEELKQEDGSGIMGGIIKTILGAPKELELAEGEKYV